MPSPVHIFCAEARRLTEYRSAVLPSLGDAFAVLAGPAVGAPSTVAEAVAAAPWCAVVLLSRPLPIPPEARVLLSVLPETAPILSGDLTTPPAQIAAAIRQRPVPAATSLLAYLRRRRLAGELVVAVEEALAGGPASTQGSRLNRRLSRFGPLRARSWRALLQILQFTSQPTEEAGVDSRTFRARSQDLVGLSPRWVLDTPGWEWKLEAALRRHGYVPWPSVTRRSSAKFTAPVLREVTSSA
jgi:hypothetical protein